MTGRFKFVIGISLIAISVGLLVYTAVDQTKMYMLTVAEYLSAKSAYSGQTLRIAGRVREDSMQWTEQTRELTGMEIGGVPPLCLPSGLPVWIDAAVMDCDYVVLGGGNRHSKIKADPQILLLQADVEVVPDLAKVV